MSLLEFDKEGREGELIEEGCKGGGKQMDREQDAQPELDKRGGRVM